MAIPFRTRFPKSARLGRDDCDLLSVSLSESRSGQLKMALNWCAKSIREDVVEAGMFLKAGNSSKMVMRSSHASNMCTSSTPHLLQIPIDVLKSRIATSFSFGVSGFHYASTSRHSALCGLVAVESELSIFSFSVREKLGVRWAQNIW